MSTVINDNILRIELPNSEAVIHAQHNGIDNKTVNGYYLNNQYDKVYKFLNNLEGNFYIDFLRTYNNINPLILRLDKEKWNEVFKDKLIPQRSSLDAIKYLIKKDKSLYKISPPIINDQKKYIKLPSNDDCIKYFKELCLGNLTNIIIQKLGIDSFLIYVEDNNKLDKFIETKEIFDWFK